jgi:PadR family transcriptional regulator, regulatory protein PadR
MAAMTKDPKLSHTAAFILQAIGCGCGYGFSVTEITGLASGTVYPALRRLETAGLVHSEWESQEIADKEQRALRRYYTLTADGEKALKLLRARYPLLRKFKPATASHGV